MYSACTAPHTGIGTLPIRCSNGGADSAICPGSPGGMIAAFALMSRGGSDALAARTRADLRRRQALIERAEDVDHQRRFAGSYTVRKVGGESSRVSGPSAHGWRFAAPKEQKMV